MKRTTVTAAVMAGLLTFGTAGTALANFGYHPSRTVGGLYFFGADFFGGGIDIVEDGSDNPDSLPYLKYNTKTTTDEYAASQDLAEQVLGEITDLDSYFGEATMAGVWNAVDDEAEEVELSELVPFVPADPTTGEVLIKAQFPSNYKVGAKVALMIGVQTKDGMKWFVALGSVTDNGVIYAHLGSEVLNSIDGPAVIGVINGTNSYAE